MRAFAVLLAVLALVAAAGVVGTLGAGTEDAEAGAWTFGESMSQRRSYVAAAEIGGQVYAAGGMVGETGRPLDLLARYDPVADSWETLQRMPEAVRAGAAAALDGVLYVIGGSTVEGTSSAVYAYDPATDGWSERASLPEPRFNHSAVALDGKIYVLGGFNEGEERQEVYVYDPATDTWSDGPSLPFPNHAFDAVAFHDEIWMIGGRRGEDVLSDVWILNRETGEWREGPAMPEGMELLGAAVAGDQIHAIWESTYQIYDDAAGAWTTGPSSLVPRHGLQTFYVDGTLVTVGGCTTQLHDSQVVERRSLPAR